jgi:cell division control protein 24
MRDKTDASDETKADLNSGIEAANRVLSQANSAVDRELRAEALEDLCARVDDWKNHRVDHFGELLLHGQFPVVTGKSDVQKEVRPPSLRYPSSVSEFKSTVDQKRKALMSSWRRSNPTPTPKLQDSASLWVQASATESEASFSISRRWSTISDTDRFLGNMLFHHSESSHPVTGNPILAERYANTLGIECPQYEQYTIYLFERILLCCKEINPNKSKDKINLGTQKDKKDKKDKNRNKESNKNAKLQLKGRIFMTNVTEVLSLAKQGNVSV